MSVERSFAAFVAARGDALWALAYLLVATGEQADSGTDERRAEELVECSLARVRPRWAELERVGAAEAEVRRELVAACLARAAAPGRVEEPAALDGGDLAGTVPQPRDDTRRAVLALLATLTPRQRAAVALRAMSVAPWDAADAMATSSAELAVLEAAAIAAVSRSSDRAAQLLHRLGEAVPHPPYAGARAERVEARAARARRRRRSVSVGAGVLAVALVAVPVLVSGQGPPDGSAPDPAPPVAERLVDPLLIPQSCARLGDRPEPPDYPYETEGAAAAWLRFCPPADAGAEAVRFAPDITVTSLAEIDELMDSWVAFEEAGSPSCDYSAFADQARVRAHVGTLDGQLHVVDMRIGTCGAVSVDGRAVSVDGRAAFVAMLALLGGELAEPMQAPRSLPAAPAFCPRTLPQVSTLARTTVRDYPRVPGLALPLPATAGLICSYPPGGSQPGVGSGTGTRGRYLEPADAEVVRAAYLARTPGVADCVNRADRTRYGVVLTDLTGSRRVFTLDPGRCGRVTGPAGAEGVASPWLTDAMTIGAATALLE